MEAEFMEAFECAKAVVHTSRLLTNADMPMREPVPILEDNEAAIKLAMKPSLNSGRARHMEVRWHWLQEQSEARHVRLGYIPTEWQVADIFTKNLSRPRFERLRSSLQGDEPVYAGEVRAALVKIDYAGRHRITHHAHMMIQQTRPAEDTGPEEAARSTAQLAALNPNDNSAQLEAPCTDSKEEQGTAAKAGAELVTKRVSKRKQMQQLLDDRRRRQQAWSALSTEKVQHFARFHKAHPDPESVVGAVGWVLTGKRYHHVDCRHLLRRDQQGMQVFLGNVVLCKLKEAREAGLSACDVCQDLLEGRVALQ